MLLVLLAVWDNILSNLSNDSRIVYGLMHYQK